MRNPNSTVTRWYAACWESGTALSRIIIEGPVTTNWGSGPVLCKPVHKALTGVGRIFDAWVIWIVVITDISTFNCMLCCLRHLGNTWWTLAKCKASGCSQPQALFCLPWSLCFNSKWTSISEHWENFGLVSPPPRWPVPYPMRASTLRALHWVFALMDKLPHWTIIILNISFAEAYIYEVIIMPWIQP